MSLVSGLVNYDQGNVLLTPQPHAVEVSDGGDCLEVEANSSLALAFWTRIRVPKDMLRVSTFNGTKRINPIFCNGRLSNNTPYGRIATLEANGLLRYEEANPETGYYVEIDIGDYMEPPVRRQV